jgi:hypothetical protein
VVFFSCFCSLTTGKAAMETKKKLNIILTSTVQHPNAPLKQNYISDFTTQLPHQISSEGAFVALNQINLTHALNNLGSEIDTIYYYLYYPMSLVKASVNQSSITITEETEFMSSLVISNETSNQSENDEIFLSIKFKNGDKSQALSEIKTPFIKNKILQGQYDSIFDLLIKFRYSLPSQHRAGIKLQFHKSINRVSIQVAKNYFLAIPENKSKLLSHLGFRKDFFPEGFHIASFAPLTLSEVITLHVCSDIAPLQKIKNKWLPVLQTITLTGRRDALLSYTFDTLQLIPINRDVIDTINIKLYNSEGEIIILQKGSVLIRLSIIWP